MQQVSKVMLPKMKQWVTLGTFSASGLSGFSIETLIFYILYYYLSNVVVGDSGFTILVGMCLADMCLVACCCRGA